MKGTRGGGRGLSEKNAWKLGGQKCQSFSALVQLIHPNKGSECTMCVILISIFSLLRGEGDM